MSQSYKKYCVCKDKNSQYGKRQASKAVRRSKDVPNGSMYKKFFCSWNICDYRCYEQKLSKKEFIENWNNSKDTDFILYRRGYNTWKEAYRSWKRYYICK